MVHHAACPEVLSSGGSVPWVVATDEVGLRRRVRRGDVVYTADDAGYEVVDPTARGGVLYLRAGPLGLIPMEVSRLVRLAPGRDIADGVDELHVVVRQRLLSIPAAAAVGEDEQAATSDGLVLRAICAYMRDGHPTSGGLHHLVEASPAVRALARDLLVAAKTSDDAVRRWLGGPAEGPARAPPDNRHPPASAELEQAVLGLVRRLGRAPAHIDRTHPERTEVPWPALAEHEAMFFNASMQVFDLMRSRDEAPRRHIPARACFLVPLLNVTGAGLTTALLDLVACADNPAAFGAWRRREGLAQRRPRGRIVS